MWWNGRHVRFRSVCRKAWEFDSPHPHQYKSKLRMTKQNTKINQIIKDIKSLTDQKNTELIHKLEFEIKIAKDREKEALKLINQIKQDPRLN